MDYKAHEVKAGIFIFISVVAFFVFLVIILGLNNMQDTAEYRTRLAFVGGIDKGSQIRYAGLEVGQVTDIYLTTGENPEIELTLEVLAGTPIHTDSYAYITSIGIMGAKYIEITAGSQDSSLFSPGDLIPSKDVAGFAQMSGRASQATDELTELLKRINDVMNDHNRANLGKMLDAVTQITEKTDHEMQDLMKNLNQLSANLNTTVQQINTMLVRNDTLISNSLTGVDTLIASSNQTMSKLNSMMDDVNYQLSSNADDYTEIVQNMNKLVRNLEIVSQSLKEQPWQLVRKNKAPEREIP